MSTLVVVLYWDWSLFVEPALAPDDNVAEGLRLQLILTLLHLK
jgi:hypothetical protein